MRRLVSGIYGGNMNRHILKTDKDVFDLSWDEDKLYEIRFDDRNFQIGDELFLVETVYTGEKMKAGKSHLNTPGGLFASLSPINSKAFTG